MRGFCRRRRFSPLIWFFFYLRHRCERSAECSPSRGTFHEIRHSCVAISKGIITHLRRLLRGFLMFRQQGRRFIVLLKNRIPSTYLFEARLIESVLVWGLHGHTHTRAMYLPGEGCGGACKEEPGSPRVKLILQTVHRSCHFSDFP